MSSAFVNRIADHGDVWEKLLSNLAGTRPSGGCYGRGLDRSRLGRKKGVLRIEYDGALYRVTSRGNDRKAICKNDSNRELFLNIPAHVNDRFHLICHGYCLMNHHCRPVIEIPDEKLSNGIRQLNGVYTQALNGRRRLGQLFRRRFKAILVQKDSHFLEVCRYVVLNPVRGKAISHPRQWKWSSYRAMAGVVSAPGCVTTDEILSHFGQRKPTGHEKYSESFKLGRMDGPSEGS